MIGYDVHAVTGACGRKTLQFGEGHQNTKTSNRMRMHARAHGIRKHKVAAHASSYA